MNIKEAKKLFMVAYSRRLVASFIDAARDGSVMASNIGLFSNSKFNYSPRFKRPQKPSSPATCARKTDT